MQRCAREAAFPVRKTLALALSYVEIYPMRRLRLMGGDAPRWKPATSAAAVTEAVP